MLHNLIFCNFFCFCNKKLVYVEIIRLLCSTRTKLSTAGPGRFNHIDPPSTPSAPTLQGTANFYLAQPNSK